MPVTVLYPEERQIPDDDLEREIFGPEIRVIRRQAKTLADLAPGDCAEVDGLMIMRYAVTPEDRGARLSSRRRHRRAADERCRGRMPGKKVLAFRDGRRGPVARRQRDARV